MYLIQNNTQAIIILRGYMGTRLVCIPNKELSVLYSTNYWYVCVFVCSMHGREGDIRLDRVQLVRLPTAHTSSIWKHIKQRS